MTSLELIKAGYNVHGKYLQRRRSALHYAALSGQPKIVEALLEASADVNCSDADGRTPLHLAALKGHDDCIRLLMKHGADVLYEDSQGRIPLDLAEERNCVGAEDIIREEMEGLLKRLTAKRDAT
jgi:ankyrin repeat protein